MLKKRFRKTGDSQRTCGADLKPHGRHQSYNEMLDDITQWNAENTQILEILRKKLPEQRLARWSEALSGGVRRKLRGSENPEDVAILSEIYRFICHERVALLKEPSMRKARKGERTEPITLCIICGIRAIQKERGHTTLLDTIKFGLLEKKFAK
ncbi:MAG: hypothetical protein GTN74_07070 [Proteobacteria bacterium]|nr:hypothetical protein [Pseudomonadota bacterium]NIS69398.1 hypothetical protein [Pseudomonadota bacterium]